MTFTTQVKNEIALSKLNELENRNLLLGYLYLNGKINNDIITVSLENLAIARKLFKTLKHCYNANIKITVRTQKKFYLEKLYIFEVFNFSKIIIDEINHICLDDEESKQAFIKGIFLAAGSINDPKKTGYHLEISISEYQKMKFILKLVNTLNYNFKSLKREKGYMLYLKSSEEISDFLKMTGAIRTLFYFEDIRIYRDHKNMVNRLNNCEQANFERTLKTCNIQVKMINFLKENDYMSLLDEKTRIVANYRIKYPEESFNSLAIIMSNETNKKVTKSYINHHFRKINEIYKKINDNMNE